VFPEVAGSVPKAVIINNNLLNVVLFQMCGSLRGCHGRSPPVCVAPTGISIWSTATMFKCGIGHGPKRCTIDLQSLKFYGI